MKIPRREARKIILVADKIEREYQSLADGKRWPVERTEVDRDTLLEEFNKNPRWQMKWREEGLSPSYVIVVPNIYAYERYVVYL